MEFKINRDTFIESLGHIQGVVEKKNTLPILSNVLIEVKDSKLILTSTDLEIIFIEEIPNVEVISPGITTTTASRLYDIVRKLQSETKIEIKLKDNKLEIKSGSSQFNLFCLPASDFPLSQQNFEHSSIKVNSKKLLKLINKTKFSVSNDETRHYLSGIFFHKTNINNILNLTAVATDSHRLSISNLNLKNDIDFEPVIIPKKTIFLLSSLLENIDSEVSVSNDKTKVKFEFLNSVLVSKVIDGKFPKYDQVIPKENKKTLKVELDSFINSVDRVITVSSDKKEGVKMNISKESIELSVNDPNSGDGKELIKSEFSSQDMTISFNSRYLMDIAAQIEGNDVIFKLDESGSPVIINDTGDNDSFYVIMPMKI